MPQKIPISIVFLVTILFVCLALFFSDDHVEIDTGGAIINALPVNNNYQESEKNKSNALQSDKPRTLTQRVTNNTGPLLGAIPRKPKIIDLIAPMDDEALSQLALTWQGMRDKRDEMMEPYQFWYRYSEKETKETVSRILKGAGVDDVFALKVLYGLLSACKSDRLKHANCDQLYSWVAKKEAAGEKFSAFERLEELAIEGNLYAQHQYFIFLRDALDSRELNTAIDVEPWLERRQRAVSYLMNFAKSGDVVAQFYLGVIFSDNIMIEANPFWAAVFFKQATLGANFLHSYENLVELHKLDEVMIERARRHFFEG